MTAAPPQLICHGELSIASVTDEFTLKGEGEKLVLIGPSLRSFFRLHRQSTRAELPPWLRQAVTALGTRSAFIIECRCRGRTIATVTGESGAINLRADKSQILRAALRF